MSNKKAFMFQFKEFGRPLDMVEKLCDENDKLRDLLRWRKWPEEKPVESGTYLVATEDAHCLVAYPLLTYYGASIGWPDYMSVTYWRPIGPLPGGER